jgi:hypothetical protein
MYEVLTPCFSLWPVKLNFLGDFVLTPNPSKQASDMWTVFAGVCDESSKFTVLLSHFCEASLEWNMLPLQLELPPGAISTGGTVINGVPALGWNFTLAPDSPGFSVFLAKAAPHMFVRFRGSLALGDSEPVPFYIDFSNTVVGPVNPSYYAKPAACNSTSQ